MKKLCRRILLLGAFAGIGAILYSYLIGKDLFPFQNAEEDWHNLSKEDETGLDESFSQELDDDLDDAKREYVSLEHTQEKTSQEDLKK